jgi:hypothetical protein
MGVVDMMFATSYLYHESASFRVDREQKNIIVISHNGSMLLKQNIPEWNMLLMIGLT